MNETTKVCPRCDKEVVEGQPHDWRKPPIVTRDYQPCEDPADMELLAAVEHEKSWSGWTTYMLNRQRRELKESLASVAAPDLVQLVMHAFNELPSTRRWERQASTSYADLSEEEKESDRIEARKKLKVYRA